MGIARYLSKLASGLSSEGVVSAAKGGTGSTSGATGGGGPKITAITVTDSGYNNLDDTAVDVAGGYIKLTGSGFASGCQVLVGSTPATSTTFVSSTEVRAQVPATTAGTYIVYLVNSDGGVAIRVNGITFSTTPTWTTGSGLSAPVNSQISIQLAATGASTFSVASGSSLPSGVSLSSSGLLSGSITGLTSPTTYTFTILATDTELQDSPQTFSFSISVGEPYFKYTTLLLSADGSNAAQNNTFTDSSTNNFAITKNGNVSPGTFTPYGNTWSTSFVTDAVVKFPYNSALTNWWTQDFTIEMWIFNNTNAGSASNNLALQFAHGDHTSSSTYWAFGTSNTGALQFYYYNGGTNYVNSSAIAELGKWHHIAMVYTNSTGNISLYLNGVSVASATKSGTPQSNASNTLNIGATQGTYYNGYISNLRVLNGTALYTSTFTPSTTPLTAVANTQLLTCQSNRFKDSSTNNAVPTIVGSPKIQRFSPFAPSTSYSTSTIGSSAYIDGSTTSYLSLTTTTAFTLEAIALATYNWTIEAWVYHTGSGFVIFDSRTGGDYSNWVFVVSSNNNLDFVVSDSAYRFTSSTGKALPYQWNHVALVHTESTYTYYINGVASGTKSFYGQGPFQTLGRDAWIGRSKDPSQSTGYISDFRFVKGTAIYTAAFTPPTAPLTAISGTQFFLNSNAGGIIDSAMMNNLQTVGDAKISTAQSKFGGSSIYFDGTGDYLTIPASPNYIFEKDFTIEMWLYVPTGYFQTIQRLVSSGNTASPTGACYFSLGNDNGIGAGYLCAAVNLTSPYSLASGNPLLWSSTLFPVATWTHVALVRSGSSVVIYQGGVSVASVTNTATWNFGGTNGLRISGTGWSSTENLQGYIDDFRITKGYARYTANFTPPTSAHSAQ